MGGWGGRKHNHKMLSLSNSGNTDLQLEFIKAMQSIHAPCEAMHNAIVTKMREEHEMELDDLAKCIEDLSESTKRMPRWRLRPEEKTENGEFASGCPIYFAVNGVCMWNESNGQSFVLEFERVSPQVRYWQSVEYDCNDIHGFIKGEGEEGEQRIICRSEKVLNQFISWVERTGTPITVGMWGFVDALKY